MRKSPAGQIKAFVRGVFNELNAFQKQSDNREVLWHRIMSPFSKCPYRGADKSLARPTCRCILSDGENISFDATIGIYVRSTNIPPIVIVNRIYEYQNLLSL